MILVNNAGGGGFGGKAGDPMRLEDDETWNRVIAVNLTGPFVRNPRRSGRVMAAAGGGVTHARRLILGARRAAGFTQNDAGDTRRL